MKKFKSIFIIILILAIVGGGYLGYSYWIDTTYYFKTDNASVSADMVTITPLVSGNILTWEVNEGDEVVTNQILGRLDLGNMIQSNAVNAQSLEQSAGSMISKSDIKTPISGKVVQSNVIIGETVAPGMQVAVVANTKNMYITANIEETDINRIKVGQKVTVSIDAYPGKTFSGYVEKVGEATQSAFSTMPTINTSGTFTKITQLIPIKITISGAESYDLRMGYNATVKIKTK